MMLCPMLGLTELNCHESVLHLMGTSREIHWSVYILEFLYTAELTCDAPVKDY